MSLVKKRTNGVFLCPQFGYWFLAWIFHSCGLNNRMNTGQNFDPLNSSVALNPFRTAKPPKNGNDSLCLKSKPQVKGSLKLSSRINLGRQGAHVPSYRLWTHPISSPTVLKGLNQMTGWLNQDDLKKMIASIKDDALKKVSSLCNREVKLF